MQGFPTLKIFKRGLSEPVTYSGSRDKGGIYTELQKMADPEWQPAISEVLVLTAENFDKTIEENDLILVEFYAPWCGHCKKLKPEYEKAARSLKDDSIPLAMVDATVERDLATRFGVTGYPTLKYFRKGVPKDFKGGRNERDIVFDMRRLKNPHTNIVDSKLKLPSVENNEAPIVVALLPGLNEESAEYQVFEELCNDYRDSYDCHHIFNEDIINRIVKVSKPAIIVRHTKMYTAKKEDRNKQVHIKSDSSIGELDKWVKANDKPLVGDMDCMSCSEMYKNVDTVRIYLSKDHEVDFDKNTKYWQEKAATVARKYTKNNLFFVLCGERSNSAEMTELKINDLGSETVFGIITAKGDKYSPNSEVLDDMDDFEETLEEFVDAYLAGKLKSRRKSAPVPKKQIGPVKVVVGETFNNIVLDKKKDVLIEFYAPWCGHCKALEPKYNKLATDLKSEKDLVIAKMDATANDVPSDFDVSGYPTIYFVPAGTNKPIPFDGQRETEDLKTFIQENAVTSMGATLLGKDEL